MAQTIGQPSATPVNRVKEAMVLLTEPEAKYQVDNPSVKQNDPHSLELRKKHFKSIVAAFSKKKDLTRDEKQSLKYVRHELRATKAKIEPTIFSYIVYSTAINKLINAVLGNRENFKSHREFFGKTEDNAIQEYNLQNLLTSLQKAGFGKNLAFSLNVALSNGMDNFSFRTTEPNAPGKTFVLHFKKVPDTKAYYFEQFDLFTHPNLNSIIKGDDQTKKITFPVYGEVTFNLLEAKNIAEGRPVMKKIDGEKRWFTNQPDMQKATFDVEKELTRWPIKELVNASRREGLIDGLQEGRSREVLLTLPEGQEIRARVSVTSDLSGLVFHDRDGAILNVPERMKVPSPHSQRMMAKAQQMLQKPLSITRNPGAKKRVS
jgi:hypothetical protein